MTGVTLILESDEERDTAVQLAIYNMAPAGAKPAQLDRCAVLCGRPAGGWVGGQSPTAFKRHCLLVLPTVVAAAAHTHRRRSRSDRQAVPCGHPVGNQGALLQALY